MEQIQVAVCVRGDGICNEQNNTVQVQDDTYQFDHVFGPTFSHEKVYDDAVFPLVNRVMDGYNACIFAWGPEGVGKTQMLSAIQHLLVDRLFTHMEQTRQALPSKPHYLIHASVLEICDADIVDLLARKSERDVQLQMRGDDSNVYLDNITLVETMYPEHLRNVFELARKRRKVRREGVAERHTIYTIIIESSYQRNDGEKERFVGRLNFIDIATLSSEGTPSLATSAVIEVASSLVLQLPDVPYSSSVVTKLMQDALGGNCITLMLACVDATNGADMDSDSAATVRFASHIMKVKNMPRVNISEDSKLAEYEKELEELGTTYESQTARNGDQQWRLDLLRKMSILESRIQGSTLLPKSRANAANSERHATNGDNSGRHTTNGDNSERHATNGDNSERHAINGDNSEKHLPSGEILQQPRAESARNAPSLGKASREDHNEGYRGEARHSEIPPTNSYILPEPRPDPAVNLATPVQTLQNRGDSSRNTESGCNSESRCETAYDVCTLPSTSVLVHKSVEEPNSEYSPETREQWLHTQLAAARNLLQVRTEQLSETELRLHEMKFRFGQSQPRSSESLPSAIEELVNALEQRDPSGQWLSDLSSEAQSFLKSQCNRAEAVHADCRPWAYMRPQREETDFLCESSTQTSSAPIRGGNSVDTQNQVYPQSTECRGRNAAPNSNLASRRSNSMTRLHHLKIAPPWALAVPSIVQGPQPSAMAAEQERPITQPASYALNVPRLTSDKSWRSISPLPSGQIVDARLANPNNIPRTEQWTLGDMSALRLSQRDLSPFASRAKQNRISSIRISVSPMRTMPSSAPNYPISPTNNIPSNMTGARFREGTDRLSAPHGIHASTGIRPPRW